MKVYKLKNVQRVVPLCYCKLLIEHLISWSEVLMSWYCIEYSITSGVNFIIFLVLYELLDLFTSAMLYECEFLLR